MSYQPYLSLISQLTFQSVAFIEMDGVKVFFEKIKPNNEWKVSFLINEFDENLIDEQTNLFFKTNGGFYYDMETNQVFLVFYIKPIDGFVAFRRVMKQLMETYKEHLTALA